MTNSCLACASLGDKAFFGLPKNKDRRAIWVVSLKLEEWFTGKLAVTNLRGIQMMCRASEGFKM